MHDARRYAAPPRSFLSATSAYPDAPSVAVKLLAIAAFALSGCVTPSDEGDGSDSTSDALINPGDNTLSYETPSSAVNGWGPYEVDRSNGEAAAGDGRPLTIAGKTYARGFGVHASSALTFDMKGGCSGFTSDFGVDAEVGGRGSVVFQVFADGAKLFDSGVVKGGTPSRSLRVDVRGKRELKLVVTDAGDGSDFDHADWAMPILRECTPPSASKAAADGASLSNDGDRFVVSYLPSNAANVTEYRLYSMRNAADPSRVMVDSAPPTARTMSDRYVADGVHVYYRVYAVVAGAEQLVYSADAEQPARAWSAPVVLTAPGTYTGNWLSMDPAVPAVRIAAGVKGVIVENARIMSRGNGVDVGAGAEVEIRGSRGWGLHPLKADSTNGKFVTGGNPSSVTVQHSYAESWLFGVYVDGQRSAAQRSVDVRFNRMRNIQGRQTNADGTYKPLRSTAGGVAHAVQLNGVLTCASVDIGWNEISQEPSIGFSEDIVNLYESSGTAASPMLVHDNVVYGGYATEPGKPATPGGEGGGAYSGCGIISDGADPSGNEASNGHLDIANNIVIATSNCGIGIAGGSSVHVHGNRMISSGVLEDGTVIWASNVGGYLWKQYTTAFHNNLMDENYSGWIEAPGCRNNGGDSPVNNSFWFPNDGYNGSKGSYVAQTYAPTPITIQTERDEYQLFWSRSQKANVVIGLP